MGPTKNVWMCSKKREIRADRVREMEQDKENGWVGKRQQAELFEQRLVRRVLSLSHGNQPRIEEDR